MDFVRLWFTGYVNPARFADELKARPAPLFGFYGMLLRAAMDSLLLYLPVFLMGRVPPEPSNLAAFPTETYYGTLVWLGPLVFLIQWLLGAAIMHGVLRLSGRPGGMDQLLNITGMATLLIGAVLLVWDWIWILLGGMNQITLGISHLVIDLWGIAIVTVALKRILGVPVWLGIVLNFLAIAASMPLAIMFMRSSL